MAYVDFNDLLRRTSSAKVFWDKAFNIAKNLKYDGYQWGLASMAYNILTKIVLICKQTKRIWFGKQRIIGRTIQLNYWKIQKKERYTYLLYVILGVHSKLIFNC